MLGACINGRLSVGVTIGIVGVVTRSSRCADRYWRSTCHTFSSVLGGGGIIGRRVLAFDDDLLTDIMHLSYIEYDQSHSQFLLQQL